MVFFLGGGGGGLLLEGVLCFNNGKWLLQCMKIIASNFASENVKAQMSRVY